MIGKVIATQVSRFGIVKDPRPAGPKVPVLDNGYIQYIEHWGCDERIIEAARMSTGKGFLGWEPGVCPTCGGFKELEQQIGEPCPSCAGTGKIAGDKNLLRRLWIKKHATPFEMAGLVLEVQAPIVVFREWHRHRTQSYAEMSARYTPLPDFNYVPSIDRLMMASAQNKQAGVIKGADELTRETAEFEQLELIEEYKQDEQAYQRALKRGVPKELARLRLPVGRYSRMRASANLRNWLAFLTLRCAEDAQWEIRQYALLVGEMISELCPRTWALFMDGKEVSNAKSAIVPVETPSESKKETPAS